MRRLSECDLFINKLSLNFINTLKLIFSLIIISIIKMDDCASLNSSKQSTNTSKANKKQNSTTKKEPK